MLYSEHERTLNDQEYGNVKQDAYVIVYKSQNLP